MKLSKLFKQVNLINKMLDGQLLEVSVRQHQITLSIKDSLVYFPQIKKMLDFSDDSKSFVSFSDDIFYFVFVNLSNKFGYSSCKQKNFLFCNTLASLDVNIYIIYILLNI